MKTMSLLNHLLKKVLLMFILINSIMNCFVWTEIATDLKQPTPDTLPLAQEESLSSPLKTLSTNNLILEKNNSQETIKHQLGDGKGAAAVVEPPPPPPPPTSSQPSPQQSQTTTISDDKLNLKDKEPLVSVNSSPTVGHMTQSVQQQQPTTNLNEKSEKPDEDTIKNDLNKQENDVHNKTETKKTENETLSIPESKVNQTFSATNVDKVETATTKESSMPSVDSKAEKKPEHESITISTPVEISVESVTKPAEPIVAVVENSSKTVLDNKEKENNSSTVSENLSKVETSTVASSTVEANTEKTNQANEVRPIENVEITENIASLSTETPNTEENKIESEIKEKENNSSTVSENLSKVETSTVASSTVEANTEKTNQANEIRPIENVEITENIASLSTDTPNTEENKIESEKKETVENEKTAVEKNKEEEVVVEAEIPIEKEILLDTKENQEAQTEQTTSTTSTLADTFQTSTESIEPISNAETIIKDFIDNVDTTSVPMETANHFDMSKDESQQVVSSNGDNADNLNAKEEEKETKTATTDSTIIEQNINVSNQEQSNSNLGENNDQSNESLTVHENELRRERNEANIKVISIQHSNHGTKYCTDVKPIKDLFTEHIEPIYYPFVNMLPEDMQLILMDETRFGGLSLASCSLISLTFFITFSVLLFLMKKCDNGGSKLTHNLNEKLIALNNEIKTLRAERETFEAVYCDMEIKMHQAESKFGDTEAKINELVERNEKLSRENEINLRELEKLRANEIKLNKETNSAKYELNELAERYQNQKNEFDTILARQQDEFSQKLNELTGKLIENETQIQLFQSSESERVSRINELETSEAQLREQLEAKEKTVIMLQNSLLKEKKPQTPTHRATPNTLQSDWNNDDFVDLNDEIQNENNLIANNDEKLNDIMKTAHLEMEMTTLMNTLSETKQLYEQKQAEYDSLAQKLNENQEFIRSFETKRKELERTIREQEVQIKLLNELREKDTKQHVKALSDMDAQLKRKSTDADKVQHLLDQLRVKQERIQDLESQMTRVEKQATQERQTFEKQAHENWLNARKFEKELKDSRNEINALRERLNEMEHVNKNMSKYFQMAPNKMANYSVNESYNKENVENETSANADNNNDAQTSSDHSGNEQQRPPSTSSNSGMNYMPPNMTSSYGYIRPPPPNVYSRFPYPLSYMQQAHQMQTAEQRATASSPTPDLVNGTQTSNAVRMPLSSPYSPYQQASMGGVPPPAMFRMHPLMLQQQYLHQQHLKSASSSQQPSPGAFYNSTMNESSYNSNNANNNSSMVNSPPRENSNEFELNESTSMVNNNHINNPIETSANFSV